MAGSVPDLVTTSLAVRSARSCPLSQFEAAGIVKSTGLPRPFHPGHYERRSAGRLPDKEIRCLSGCVVLSFAKVLTGNGFVVRTDVDERCHPANHFQAALLKEAHHVREFREACKILVLETRLRTELRLVEGEVVVGDFPRRVEDERGNRDFPLAKLGNRVPELLLRCARCRKISKRRRPTAEATAAAQLSRCSR